MGMFDIVGDIFGAYTSHREAEMSRDWNESEAAKKREWDERMANTQYQRTVADLNAAGLSPMLAYSKGATTLPSGATASGGAVGQGVKFGETASRNAQAELAREQINVAKAQEQLNIANAKKAAEEAKLTALTVEQMPTRFYYDLANIGSQINSNSANAKRTNIQAINDANLEAPGTGVPLLRDLKNLSNKLISSARASGERDPTAWFNDFWKNVNPSRSKKK